jgi:hypothetical protein
MPLGLDTLAVVGEARCSELLRQLYSQQATAGQAARPRPRKKGQPGGEAAAAAAAVVVVVVVAFLARPYESEIRTKETKARR